MDKSPEQILDITVGYKTRIILRNDALEAMKIAMKQAFLAGIRSEIKAEQEGIGTYFDDYLRELEEKK